jgi:hypothetical protein
MTATVWCSLASTGNNDRLSPTLSDVDEEELEESRVRRLKRVVAETLTGSVIAVLGADCEGLLEGG